MAKQVAPPKSTAGGGFGFEDKVVAYYLACMLAGHPPLDGEPCSIARMDFQTRVDGWFLDDILLTLANGQTHKVALSVKSNVQFSGNSVPADFADAAWEQFLHKGSTAFDPDTDYLGLITVPIDAELAKQIHELLSWAQMQDPKDLPGRLSEAGYASDTKRDLFESLSRPHGLAVGNGVDSRRTGELLRRLLFVQFDFEQSPSKDASAAIACCRSVLRSELLNEACTLWDVLQSTANSYRPASGFLDYPRLIQALRDKFRLKRHPNYRLDWQKLDEQTSGALKLIPDKIGGLVHVRRPGMLDELTDAVNQHEAVVILGPSGTGKTVLAKTWAEEKLKDSTLLWWQATQFDEKSYQAFESPMGMSMPLSSILSNSPDAVAYVVIDGADRIFASSAFANLAAVIRHSEVGESGSPWRVVITCQPEEWARVQAALTANGVLVRWHTMQMQGFSGSDDLSVLWKAFPSLQLLASRPDLQSVMLRPKILDIVATRLSLGESVDPGKWLGESDVIGWFWDSEVSSKPDAAVRSSFLLKLATIEGDALAHQVATSEFDPSDLSAVDELRKDKMCVVRGDNISFAHDLYGDWARQRKLLSLGSKLPAFVNSRLDAPLWHRALRLYGVYLLEQENGQSVWKTTFGEFATLGDAAVLGQDLLLDSVIVAAGAQQHLESMWSELAAESGGLLRRLLRRFLHVATVPDPWMAAITRSLGTSSEAEAATWWRVPYWPYWLPVLTFLHKHSQEVTELAPAEAEQVADLWLRKGGNEWPLRKEAAELAIPIAERALDPTPHVGCRYGGYRAALAAAGEAPERVTDLVLRACKRKSEGDTGTGDPRPSVTVGPLHYKAELPPPWPDGPFARVDAHFQKTCLTTDILYPLIEANPDVAREVILALLISEPVARSPFDYSPIYDLEIERVLGWFPPLYTQGPLLFFLNKQPDEGLGLIIRLVNFATDRWAEKNRRTDVAPPSVRILLAGEERRWTGDVNIFLWYQGYGQAPEPVCVALMCLEKWLYDQLDAGHDVSGAIGTVMDQSASVTFAGVLCAAGDKSPDLFEGPLLPLLAVPEFHDWEEQRRLQSSSIRSTAMIGYLMKSDWLRKMGDQWHALPHRDRSMAETALKLFLGKPDMRPFFDELLGSCQTRLESQDWGAVRPEHLERLVVTYDRTNWSARANGDDGFILECTPPKEIQERNDAEARAAEKRMAYLTFPMRCRQIIDCGEPLTTEDAARLWDDSHSLADLEDTELGVIGKEDITCGACAALLLCGQEWLDQNSEIRDKCVEQVMNTAVHPPPIDSLGGEFDAYNMHWDSFCAEVIPQLWALEPDSRVLREPIALLTASYRYNTVEALFRACGKHRVALGRSLRQLQHFLIRWSAARLVINQAKHGRREGLDIEARWQEFAVAFIEGSLSPDTPPWEEIGPVVQQKAPEHPFLNSSEGYNALPGLDLTLIQRAYAWLPSLHQAADENERNEWVGFCERSLVYLLRLLGGRAKDHGEVRGTPYEWDYWVLDLVGGVVAGMRADESPERLWRPVMDMGVGAHYWVESFLERWSLRGFRSGPAPDAFIDRWKEMIEFAFSSPGWDLTAETGQWRRANLWHHLLAFDSSLWTGEQSHVVERLKTYYERWADLALHSSSCARCFMRLLRQPAGTPVRVEALVWIAKGAAQCGEHWWEEDTIQDDLATLLAVCWEQQQNEVRQTKGRFEAFKNLHKVLLGKHNHIAMEIQARM